MDPYTCPSWFSFSLDNFLRRRFQDPYAIMDGYLQPGAIVMDICDASRFFSQIAAAMKEESRYLLVEPKLHVAGKNYRKLLRMAEAAGLKQREEPVISLSRAMLLTL